MTHRRLTALLAAFVVATTCMGLTASAAVASTSSMVVTIPGNQRLTDTGVTLQVGDVVSISATGTIYIAGFDPGKTPAGAPGCVATADNSIPPGPFAFPGLTCFALVGQVGTGAPFQVGAGTTLAATNAGELFLGVNDNFYADNSGAWTATITVTPSALHFPYPFQSLSSLTSSQLRADFVYLQSAIQRFADLGLTPTQRAKLGSILRVGGLCLAAPGAQNVNCIMFLGSVAMFLKPQPAS